MMSRKRANELGLTIMAKYITTAVCGLAPRKLSFASYIVHLLKTVNRDHGTCAPSLLLCSNESQQGIGPVYAIPQALAQAGITIKDVDLFEV